MRRGLQRWTDDATARAVLVLEEPAVAADRSDVEDGVNTIGFTADESFRISWVTASARWSITRGVITQCDARVSPYFVKNWAPQDPRRLLEIVVTHQVGHCLGLLHSEPHPMPLWTGLPVARDEGFLPDPVMSYSNSYGLELPADDLVAVSLLYPAEGFTASRGSVSGTVIRDARPVPFAYVQSVRPGADGTGGRPGPGAFANEDGVFLVEGLAPSRTWFPTATCWMSWTPSGGSPIRSRRSWAIGSWREVI